MSLLLLLPTEWTPATPPTPGPTVGHWTYLLCGINGTPIGEPLADGRSLTVGVSRTATATCQVTIGTRVWDMINAGAATLKVYNSSATLVFWGDIVTDELAAEANSKTVQCTAADLSYRLARRYIGKSGTGVTYTSIDAGTIIFTELATANAEFPTGISVGNKDSFFARTLTFNWRKFSDVMADLGAITSSYEWTLRYVDGTPPTVFLDLLGTVGADESATVFLEYGTGKNNLESYRRVRSIDQLATRVYGITQGSTNSVVAFDPGSESLRRFEDVISVADVTDAALLDALVAAHVAFRHAPRRTVTVKPHAATAPPYGVEWAKGDTVSLRAVIEDTVDTDGTARVWAATIAIDKSGNEDATLTLNPD